jgi:hypothetical protein
LSINRDSQPIRAESDLTSRVFPRHKRGGMPRFWEHCPRRILWRRVTAPNTDAKDVVAKRRDSLVQRSIFCLYPIAQVRN